MIRHIALVEFTPGTTPAQTEALAIALRSMRIKGMQRLTCGLDLGLKVGNVPFAAVAEFDDLSGFRNYDTDEEHNRIRRELVAPITQRLFRTQYEL